MVSPARIIEQAIQYGYEKQYGDTWFGTTASEKRFKMLPWGTDETLTRS